MSKEGLRLSFLHNDNLLEILITNSKTAKIPLLSPGQGNFMNKDEMTEIQFPNPQKGYFYQNQYSHVINQT